MWLGGDPDGIRRSAAQLRNLADTAGAQCAVAQHQLAHVVWVSAAASAFEQQVTEDFALYGRVAAHVVDTTVALEELANTLSERQRVLVVLAGQIGRSVEDLYHGALEVGQDVVSYASDLADDLMNGVGDALGSGKNLVGGVLGAVF